MVEENNQRIKRLVDIFGEPTDDFCYIKTVGPGVQFHNEKVPSTEVGFCENPKKEEVDNWVSKDIQAQILFCLDSRDTDDFSYKTNFLYQTPKKVGTLSQKLCPVSIRMFHYGQVVYPEYIEKNIFETCYVKTDIFYIFDLKKVVKGFGRAAVINQCSIGMSFLAIIDVGDAHSSNEYLLEKKYIIH